MSANDSLRIFVVSGYSYWGNFLPSDLDKGNKQIGGGETAMIQVARSLADRGHQVTVFYDVARPGRYDEVDYLPTDMFVPLVCQMEHDVLVSWDNPHVFRYADRSKMHVLAFQLNDAEIGVYDHAIDLYLHPSKWHSDRFHKLYPEMSTTKMQSQMTNAVDYNRYTEEVEKEPYRVMYSSSPDRGLHHLLRIWPNIVEQVPEATLHVYYDIDNWLKIDKQMKDAGYQSVTGDRAELVRNFIVNAPESVIFHGGIGQAALAKEQLKSHLLVYPCDPVNPTEGFSMTVLEGIAAGCKVIISDADAFPELWSHAPNVTMLPLPIQDETWVDVVVNELHNPPIKHQPLDVIKKKWSWPQIAFRWEKEFHIWMALQQSQNSSELTEQKGS